MLTYTEWLETLARCRLDQFDRSFVESLANVTKHYSDSKNTQNEEINFVHFFDLVLLLLKEHRKAKSQYVLFNVKDQTIVSLTSLPRKLLPDINFWKCVHFLDEHKLFNAPNLHHLIKNQDHSESMCELLHLVKHRWSSLFNSKNIEKILANGEKAKGILQVLSQLLHNDGWIQLVNQTHFDRLFDYSGKFDDLYGISVLIATIHRNARWFFFSNLTASFFNLIISHAQLAVEVNTIFSLLDKRFTSEEQMNQLLHTPTEISFLASVLQSLIKKGTSEEERTYCFKMIRTHRVDVGALSVFFTKINQALLTDRFTSFIDLLFEHANDLPVITRLFVLLNQLKGTTLKFQRAQFFFQYKAIFLNPEILDLLEALSKKGFLSSARLEKLILTSAHYTIPAQIEILKSAFLKEIELFSKSRPGLEELKVTKRSPDKMSSQYTPDLVRFLSELDESPELNPTLIDALTDLEGFACPISGTTMVTPVKLGEIEYDLYSLIKLDLRSSNQRRNPATGDHFKLNEIRPDRVMAQAIKQAIAKFISLPVNAVKSETDTEVPRHGEQSEAILNGPR